VYSESNLRDLLVTYDVNDNVINSILMKKREHLYQVACLRLYEAVHKGGVADNVGNHPNGFFNSSVAYMRDTGMLKGTG
jgi:hypothetical protein